MLPPPSSARSRAEVSAGRIVGAFGLAGELKLDASRVGADALRPGLAVTLRFHDGRTRAATVTALRRHQGRPLIRIADVADAVTAATLSGADLLLARADVALADGEFFDDDLIGCRLIDADGVERGDVVHVAHYPAQDMLVVGPDRLLVPLVRAFVAHIDLERRVIHVTVPPGLLDPAHADEG